MNIIDKLNIQLTKIKAILLKEIDQGEYTYNYYICEDEHKFLDYFELQSYLTSTSIENTIFLKGINELCVEISDFWNNELQKIPMKHFKEDFGFVGKYKSGNSTLSFQALYIKESKIIDSNSLSGKRNFVEKYNFSDINIKIIADRCNIIINSITAAYPETIPERIEKLPKIENSRIKDDKDSELVDAIEDQLSSISDELNEESYRLLERALYVYFKNGVFPKLDRKITFKSINKKRVGWALNCLYNELKPTEKLSLDYLMFAKNNINLFKKTSFDKKNYLKSNLYKYFTQKP